MDVKIDTKEKFTVLTPKSASLPANMTGRVQDVLLGYLDTPVPHIVLNLVNVKHIDAQIAEKIAVIQQQFYENNFSFVICELQEGPELLLDKLELLELLNITRTESEAWDIIQMEEIERELTNETD